MKKGNKMKIWLKVLVLVGLTVKGDAGRSDIIITADKDASERLSSLASPILYEVEDLSLEQLCQKLGNQAKLPTISMALHVHPKADLTSLFFQVGELMKLMPSLTSVVFWESNHFSELRIAASTQDVPSLGNRSFEAFCKETFPQVYLSFPLHSQK